LSRFVAPDAQLATGHPQQERGPGLEHLHAATCLKPHFGHPTDPAGITINLGDIRPLAGTKQIQWQKGVGIHGNPGVQLLRLNLNNFIQQLGQPVNEVGLLG
jgi:hypothetical protein